MEAFRISRGSRIEAETEHYLDVYALALLQSRGEHLGSSPQGMRDEMFSQELPNNARGLISVGLLRLLDADQDAFTDHSFLLRTFNLFDDVFARDLYHEIGIAPKQQTFEKQNALRDVVPEIESAFTNVVDSVGSFDDVPEARKEFKRLLKSVRGRAVIGPFLPDSLLAPRLDQTFSSALAVHRSNMDDLSSSVQRAEHDLGEYRREAEAFGTSYSSRFLGGLAQRLEECIRAKVEVSGVAKPATLEIVPTEKVYPLDSPGHPITLQLRLTNQGLGPARDVLLRLDDSQGLEPITTDLMLGTRGPGDHEISLDAVANGGGASGVITGSLTWTNADGSEQTEEFWCDLPAAPGGIEWEAADLADPYSLEPVTTEEKLEGREALLRSLSKTCLGETAGNAFISGQKRVGKTSIARVLANRVQEESHPVEVIYLDGGEYVDPDANRTIAQLSRAILNMARHHPKLQGIDIPDAPDSLAAVSEFASAVERLSPQIRLLIILDEFDELPLTLYRRGEIGDAFFLGLRSLGGKANVSTVLVGGEKMNFILSSQGEQLNKFEQLPVDYFPEAALQTDFASLARKPAERWLTFTDAAVERLFQVSAGNPFFAKLICRTLFDLAVASRDGSITAREVDRATQSSLQLAGSNVFSHFWEDGIVEIGPKAEELSVHRRKILLSLAEILRRSEAATHQQLVDTAARYGVDKARTKQELDLFVQRKVLRLDQGEYSCKVPLFERWLMSHGSAEVLTTLTEADALMRDREADEKARVKPAELSALVDHWGLYQGGPVTVGSVESWLNQFRGPRTQRAMFNILDGLTFYSPQLVKEKLDEIHRTVLRRIAKTGEPLNPTYEEGQRKRGDLLISHLDGTGKSGAQFAKLYRDENDIYYDNVKEVEALREAEMSAPHVRALVFVDDFLATGNSAAEGIRSHADTIRAAHDSGLLVYVAVICAFEDAVDRLEAAIAELGISVDVVAADVLSDIDRCFSEDSRFFNDDTERLTAREASYEHGTELVRTNPHGYGDCQAAVVFHTRCPNNSLPVLWQVGKNWRPLFPR